MTGDQAGVKGGRHLRIADPRGTSLFDSPVDDGNGNAELEAIFAWLGEHDFFSGLAAAGHPIVQGGPRYRDPQRITPEFLSEMQQFIALDPDHTPAALRGVQFVAEKFPDL